MRILLFAALAVRLAAQTLTGQVTDESGALVPEAQITLTAKSGAIRTATADARGAYSITIAAGDYTIAASAPRLIMQPVAISIHPGAQSLNLQLKVAATTQQVTVHDTGAPQLSTDASSNAGALVLRGTDLDALSDDPEDLAADLQALAGPSAGPSGGSIFIDGFSGGEIPPKNSIRDVRINQNPFAAEFDKLGLGRIEIFTKPGSDKYHAQVDYNFADSFWNSRNPYSAQKAPLLLNELEGNAGGPVTKRSSFTLDFQRNAVNNGYITNGVNLDGPFSAITVVPQRFLRLSPRIDYQLSQNNTLIFRYSITRSYIDGVGIGNFDLPSRGYYFQYTNQTAQITDTQVFGTTVNETRFQYFRAAPRRIAKTDGPEIQVLQAFNDGGSQVGRGFDYQNNYEFQNNTMAVHGAHAIKFGARLRGQTDDNIAPTNFNGTFTFAGGDGITSIERYRLTILHLPGGGASQFSINAGNPEVKVGQMDAGLYVADDWRVRPNITVSLGLRYEVQTNISDWRDIAPRFAIAWAPKTANSRPKTVFRAGFGTFYDRLMLTNVLTAERYNGINQIQYVITNPPDFPIFPPLTSASPQIVERISPAMRAPYILQTALTVERQLPANTTLAVSYTNSHGVHMFRSNAIDRVFVMESTGIYNQNQLIANVNARVNPSFSLFGFYVLNKAMSDTDGINTFPANPNNFAGEYGPASTDIRHRVTLGGSINTRWAVRLSPYFVIQSGQPFNITSGTDPFGAGLFNARPGIATDPTKPGLVETKYGLLDPNPLPGETILTRNSGRGPGQIAMNLRVAKTIGFGPLKERRSSSTGPASGGMANAQMASGGGLRNIIGQPSSDRRYNLSISMSVRNLLNHTNPGPINGNITSPLFGLANQMAGGLNGEGFSENANNRRLEMQIRLTF